MRSKNFLLAAAFIAFAVVCVFSLVHADRNARIDKLQIQSKTIDLKAHQLRGEELLKKLELETQKDVKDQERIKQLEQENTKFQQETQELQKQLQAKKASKAQIAASKALNTVTRTQTVSAASNDYGGCSGNADADFIYMKESGCRTSAVNHIGCRGIGQACPGSKLPCGDDFACQHQYFSNYAIQRYGSWSAARAFWVNNRWW